MCLVVMLCSISALNAQTYTKVGCVSDDQNNRYSLTATSNDRVIWGIDGNTELAVDPGVFWPTKGKYDTLTKRLTITLINPHPDNCRDYNDSVEVVLRYIGNTTYFIRNGRGNFFNFCAGGISGDNSITAAAVPGSCGASPRPSGNDNNIPPDFGGMGSTSNLPPHYVALPTDGIDFNQLLRVNDNNVTISPNPAVGRAQIFMSVDKPSTVDIRIYDQFGRLIRTLTSSTMDEGSYSFNWDFTGNSGSTVENGLYIVVIKTDNSTITKRIMVIR